MKRKNFFQSLNSFMVFCTLCIVFCDKKEKRRNCRKKKIDKKKYKKDCVKVKMETEIKINHY